MFIDELPKDSPIILNVRVQGKTLTLKTHIIKDGLKSTAKKYASCSLIIINDKILRLNKCLLTALIHNVEDERDYRFEISSTFIDHKNKVLRLYSNNNVKPENYRGACRFPCTYRTVLQIGNNRKAINGYTHDLSYTGVSYVFTADSVPLKVGDSVSGSIYLDDDHMKRTSGTIVRIIEAFKPDLTLIGVAFERDTNVQGLIGVLQMKELKVRHDTKK